MDGERGKEGTQGVKRKEQAQKRGAKRANAIEPVI
jgi:hypothetical protein